jgi:hypothetical protein
MSVTLDLTSAMRKDLKLISDGGDSGSKKRKRGYDGAYDGVWWSLRLVESGVRWSVLCWCVWQESDFSRREDVFTFNLLNEQMLYILYFQCYLQI